MPWRLRKSSSTPSVGLGLALAVLLWAGAPAAMAGGIVINGSFGPNGDIGFVNSPPDLSISFGADDQGQIGPISGNGQMDAFINAAGENWNQYGSDSGFGTATQMTYGPPPGIAYAFAATQTGPDTLYMFYTFTNNTGSALSNFQFMPYVNPFFGTTVPDDYATVKGSTSSNPQLGAQTYQAGDANTSSIFTNVNFGALNNTNSASSPIEGVNVAMALGLTIGTFNAGQTVTFEVLLSDNDTSIGNLSIIDQNPNYPGDTLTLSALQIVPEPSSIVLLGIGSLGALAWGVGHRRRRSRVNDVGQALA
jgi:hypothetical protein